jgi:hypothetical protein
MSFRLAAYAVCLEDDRTLLAEVAGLRRSSLVDIGLAPARTVPATGHVEPVPVGGLIRH